ncbi:hypothetical protein D3C87_726080 [compost metagenome]
MLNYIYMLFFLSLNIYIYVCLNKASKLKPLFHFFITSIFVVIILLHEFEFITSQITKPQFNRIFFFSYILIFFCFFNKQLIREIAKKQSFNAFSTAIVSTIEKGIFLKFIFLVSSIVQLQIIHGLK